jgi:hypothetical protein
MLKAETIEEFYKRKFNWVPNTLHKEIGHVNVIRLNPYVGKRAKPVPYSRKVFYKITITPGSRKVYYADKCYEVRQQALTFSNPNIAYK